MALWTVMALGVFCSPAAAQSELTEVREGSTDPIGVEDHDGLGSIADPIEQAPQPARAPQAPRVQPREGAVVTTISGVRETEHAVAVELYAGLAEVATTLTFASRARHPAEVLYRLPLPEGARILSFDVCRGERCRQGTLDGQGLVRSEYLDALQARPLETSSEESTPLPIGYARRFADENGAAVELRIAPVVRGENAVVHLRYITEAPVHGGVARFTLPARGSDARARAARVEVSAPALERITLDGSSVEGALDVDPWFDVEIAARVAPGSPMQTVVVSAPCPDDPRQRCARTHSVSGSSVTRPANIILMLDASASTEGPTRGRMGPAIAALLATAPSGSQVRALAFGSRAEAVLEAPLSAADVPLVPLTRAATTSMGPSTDFAAAWEIAKPWVRAGTNSQLVIIGDGSINDDAASRAAIHEARRQRATISVVDLSGQRTDSILHDAAAATSGIVEAGAEAERNIRGRGAAQLEERLSAVFAPRRGRVVVAGVSLGAIRAGEQAVWEGRSRRRVRLRGAGTVVRLSRHRQLSTSASLGFAALTAGSSASCNETPPPAHPSGISTDDAPVAIATPRQCDPPTSPPPSPTAGLGVPAETVLAMLRRRIVPQARRCFRRDRAGRVDYSVRAAYRLELYRREVVSSAIEGEMTDALRSCLGDTLHTLDIPYFEGRVVVRYPVYTMREAPEPTIELQPDLSEAVDGEFTPVDIESLRRGL